MDAMAVATEGEQQLEKALKEERQTELNFRNMLSAHTTNCKGAPLGSHGNLANCFEAVGVQGGIRRGP